MKLRFPICFSIIALLAGCGAGEDVAGIGGTGEPVKTASTVGATGIGEVTGFGSVFINDNRHFETNIETQFVIDDIELSEAEFRQRGTGFIVNFDVGEDVNADMTAGTAKSVRAQNVLKGPVTGSTPFAVLNMPVVTTANTVLVNVPGNNIVNLPNGAIVEVSGYLSTDNAVDATRVEYKSTGLPVWELNGYISNYVANVSFSIGTQVVVLNGATISGCTGGIGNDSLVEVQATPDTNLAQLDTVTGVRCKQDGLEIPDNPNNAEIQAEVEGIVSAINSPAIFVVNGQAVQHGASTEFEGGSAADILPGVRLEAEGKFNVASNLLIAKKIRFRRSVIYIEAPVKSTDILIGQSLKILGATVRINALTKDDDNIVSGGLSSDRQVEVLGIADSGGLIMASEIKNKGGPDYSDIRIRGSVTGIANPLLDIAGIVIDTNSAQELDGKNVNPANQAAFFNKIDIGTHLKVEEGVYDVINKRVTNAKIDIEN